MTQLIHEPNLTSASPARPRVGVAFVPCAICLTPVDISTVAEGDVQLCAKHGAVDYLPVN